MKKFGKIVPEEKLLHLIEKPEQTQDFLINTGSGRGKLYRSKKWGMFLFFQNFIAKRGLRGINNVFIIIGVFATFFLTSRYIKEERYLKSRFETLQEQMRTATPIQTIEEKKEIPVISEYLTETRKNNPFHAIDFVKKQEPQMEKKLSLSLVGIIWSEPPQAIIEDAVSKKNYIVSAGNKIEKYTVKEITQNSVTLGSEDGEEILK